MRNYREGFICLVCLICLAAMTVPKHASAAALPKFITITSYPIGSLSSLLATGFCSAIDKSGVRARPTPADTDMGRLMPVRSGEAQAMLLTGASVYTISNGLQEFSAKSWGPQKIRIVYAGNYMFNGMGVKADSGIKTWADLKGKRVAMAPGFQGYTIPGFLAYGGLTVNDVKIVRAPGHTASAEMVMAGAADACHVAAQSPNIKQWESSPYGLRYLPFNPKDKEAAKRMAEKAPFMSLKWANSGALGEGGPKWVASYPFILSTYDNVDEDIIYLIIKSLVKNRDLYKGVQKPASEEWTLEETLNLDKPVFIPFHPGVIKYAKEKGKWTAKHEAFQAKALAEESKRLNAFNAQK